MKFFALLAILFVVLRLTGVIDWPWIWILCPVWIPPIGAFTILVLVVISYMLVGIAKGIFDYLYELMN